MRTQEPKAIYLKDYQPPKYFIDNIKLEFKLSPTDTMVTAVSEIRINNDYPHGKDAQPLFLVGENLQLEGIAIDQRELVAGTDYEVSADGLCLLMPPKHFNLTITTRINPQDNTALEGLYLTSNRFCTQCEAHGFRRITYYLDRPDVMARFTTKIIADKKHYPVLLSNGNLIESGMIDAEQHYAVWEDPHRKPAYLFALVAGDLCQLEDKFITASGREVAIHFYVEEQNKHQCAHAIESLKNAMKWDEDTYGLEYDLDIYMVVAVNDFNMGAMENKGLNIFNAKYVLAEPATATDKDYADIESVIGHEYFHNWTGNRITLRDWFQLSLKEGLTVYRDQEFSADMGSRGVQRVNDVNVIKTAQFAEDAGPMAHPIRPDSYIEMNNFYTVTVYNKGAEVIRMLETLLTKEGFKQGMDLYVARHDGQAITTDDFVKAMADANHADLEQFLLWYAQAGTPVVEASWQYDASNKQFRLDVKQHTAATPNQNIKKPFLIPIRVALYNQAGQAIELKLQGDTSATGTETVLKFKQQEQSFIFEGVNEAVVPSLLRGFSAPVKLITQHSLDEKLFLLQHDTDAYNRCEANQSLCVEVITDLIKQYQNHQTLSFDVKPFKQAYEQLLADPDNDVAAIAQILSVPTENYIAETFEQIDIDAIHHAREYFYDEVAKATLAAWQACYQRMQVQQAYAYSAEQTAKRALQNLALFYLFRADADLGLELALQQYASSDNMSSQLPALQVIARSEAEQREQVLTSFYEKWKNEPLVVNKWLSVNALSSRTDTTKTVAELTEHAGFDWKNPNNNYALLVTYSRQNPYAFHAKSGEGYRLLIAAIKRVDKMNPQVAARLFGVFLQWRRYDKERQSLQEGLLRELLAEPGLSKDVYELLTKALS